MNSERPPHKFEIPPGSRWTKCRSCQQPITWIETKRGKRMPLNPDGISHFATCPDADRWRKRHA